MKIDLYGMTFDGRKPLEYLEKFKIGLKDKG